MTPKLDDCNVSFYGLPARRLRRLQLFGDRGQNTFLPWPPHVGLVPGAPRWLRLKHQLDLNIALMAYNAECNRGSVRFIYAAAFYEL